MSKFTVKPIEGRTQDQNETDPLKNLPALPVTGDNVAGVRRALHVAPFGYFEVNASIAVEAGSTDTTVVVTGHGHKKGDVLRFLATVNPIEEIEAVVDKVIDANTFQLAGQLSDTLSVGDTYQHMRAVRPRYADDGSSLATIVAPPIQFVLDGANQTVIEDTGVPANNAPLPVKLTGVTGDVNITAGDLNVQLNHAGASFDSVQIGDGTELLAINASNEAQVRDDDANTELATLNTKINTLGQKTMANSTPVVIASDQSAINVNDIGGTVSLPTGAATEAKQDDAITQLTSIAGEDFATEVTLAALNAKFNSLGQKASANSAPVVLSSEQQTILNQMLTSLQLLDNIVNGSNQADVRLADLNGAATEATLASIAAEDFATETTLAAMSAKLPALGRQTAAASQPVVQSRAPVQSFINHDASATNITSAAYVEMIADTGASATSKLTLFVQAGTPMFLALGAAAAEVDYMVIPPGGLDGQIEVEIPANSRVSLKAITGTMNSGRVLGNLMN